PGDPGVPRTVEKAIELGQLPVGTDIAYDPKWPGRTWLAEVPYSDDNRLFIYSLTSVMLSGLLTVGLMLFSDKHCLIPPAGIGPFLGMTALFGAAGFLQGW